MKKILFIFTIFIFTCRIQAVNYRGCDSSEIARMKALINNVNISYDYVMNDYPVFSITINNITPDLYFVDSVTKVEYKYQDTNNGEIVIGGYGSGNDGRYKFYSAKSECYGLSLGTKYYKTPNYNQYYNDPLCDGLDINICKKWSNTNYSRPEFEQKIQEYKENKLPNIEENTEYKKTLGEKIIEFYVKYYIYILLFIIISCSLLIYIKNKKDRFKL